VKMYRIAVGGHACRTMNDADLYVDRYARSETSAHAHLRHDQILHDPTDEQLLQSLTAIAPQEDVEIYSSMQGRYSLLTVPKLLSSLGQPASCLYPADVGP
jgi:hypothetical protein